jgi:thiamine-phosphate pyrophosphorylase
MQLIIISHPVILENEVAYLDRLTGEGLQTIHLRKPGATEGEIIQLIEQMDENLRKRVMIHSHFSIARQYGLKGIHYTWKDKHLPVKADELQKSMSVHSIEETERPQYRDLDY